MKRLGQLGCVDVGVVTGNNRFFVLTEAQVRSGSDGVDAAARGQNRANPRIGVQQTGMARPSERRRPLSPTKSSRHPLRSIVAAAQEYVTQREETEARSASSAETENGGTWLPLSGRPTPSLRQIHTYPKIVCQRRRGHFNGYHLPGSLESASAGALIAATFLNAMTFAFTEVTGRSYGGGVLEMEPNEAEQLPIPFFDDTALDFEKIDRLERAGE